METNNLGITIDTRTTIIDDVRDIYAALTGDQCAVTDIRIRRETESGKPAASAGIPHTISHLRRKP